MSESNIARDLRRRLGVFVPSDAVEERAVESVLALLGADAAFCSTRFDPGHITASAFVVHPSDHAVGLILHSKIRRWLQPGGHVEPDDADIFEAALREVREEVGVGPASTPWLCDVDVHTFPARGDVPTHLHHDVRVAFRADSDQLMSGDGAEDVRWWSFDEALALEESIARPVRKLADWLSVGN
jgi:8-oxo-dGTP pyrophosphatase MutT (NUDIX family)